MVMKRLVPYVALNRFPRVENGEEEETQQLLQLQVA